MVKLFDGSACRISFSPLITFLGSQFDDLVNCEEFLVFRAGQVHF